MLILLLISLLLLHTLFSLVIDLNVIDQETGKEIDEDIDLSDHSHQVEVVQIGNLIFRRRIFGCLPLTQRVTSKPCAERKSRVHHRSFAQWQYLNTESLNIHNDSWQIASCRVFAGRPAHNSEIRIIGGRTRKER